MTFNESVEELRAAWLDFRNAVLELFVPFARWLMRLFS